jgi:uridine kinase
MHNIVVGITGGSGAGKSTLGENLIRAEPDIFVLIQLDDYLRKPHEVPILEGRENWDHPAALDFETFARDLADLKEGRKVVLRTKNRRFNPDYGETRIKIPIEVRPKPVILAEGFLVLYDPHVRTLLDRSIWLDAPSQKRWDRRVHFKDDEYRNKIYDPMHAQYIQPTRVFADKILDADQLNQQEIFREIESWFQPYFHSGELGRLI